jgi:uncharacterized protein DUF5990
VVDDAGTFVMFRRAKLWLDAVPAPMMEAAYATGLLIGRLGLSDDDGWPLCASVRPPRIEWSTADDQRHQGHQEHQGQADA